MGLNEEKVFNKPYKLSKEQIKAISSGSKYIKLVAGAGTGKTETLTRRIIYLLLCKDVQPKDIVAFTFTEKAAQDMKSRIYDRLVALGGKDAAFNLGEMYVGTIHGFCYRLLQDTLGYGDYNIIDENADMALLTNNLGWKLGLQYDDNSYSRNCLKFLNSVNIVYDELIDRKKLRKNSKKFYDRLQAYEEFHKKHKLLTFSMSIALLVEKLDSNLQLLHNIKQLIVDEYQDINKAQEKLIEKIGKTAKVFVVGDPRQSIYQWRGSNEAYFDNFSKNFKGVQEINIVDNWRSDSNIVKVANMLADNLKSKYPPLKSVSKQNGSVYCLEFSTPEEEAEWIAKEIKNLKQDSEVDYSDIAVLFRSVSNSSKPIIDAFRKMDIPYIVGGKVGLFKRSEVRAVAMLMIWLSEKGYWSEPFNKSNKVSGDALLENGASEWSKSTNITVSKEELKIWRKKVLEGGSKDLIDAYYKLLNVLGYVTFDSKDKVDAAIMANLGRFSSIIKDFEFSIGLGGKKKLNAHVLNGLFWYINSYASTAYEEAQPEDLRGLAAVQILTVHQAKGLEWPIVFIPSMVSKRFPSSKIGQEGDWYTPRELFDYKRYQGSIDDERKLFYVALTRAKNHLILSYFTKTSKNKVSKSGFIKEISQNIKNVSYLYNVNLGKIRKKDYSNDIRTFPITEIIAYTRCPYFYQFRFSFGYNSSLNEFLGYGKSLHFCLRNIADKFRKEGVALESVESIINQSFHLPYAHKRQNDMAKRAATEALFNFVKKHIDDIKKVNEVEVRLEFPLNRAIIVGRADVIIKTNANELEVRDYKTSDVVITKDESDLQVRLYAFGLNSLGKNITSGSVANIENNEVRKVNTQKSDLENAVNITTKAINSIAGANYLAITGKHCLECDFLNICRFGKRYIEHNLLT
ncbi:MAG: ATP-dependent DNA helicase [Caldisphaera sp.]